MAERVCPWWLGYLLASPLRRCIAGSPEKLLAPFVKEGMTVLEPGPGMGFFTLPLARLVGPAGRVVALDVQPKMLDGLRQRTQKAGLLPRIETRLAQPDSMRLDDLSGKVDFVLAFAVVHEMPSAERFFAEAAAALKPGGLLLFSEPAGHVTPPLFQTELDAAQKAALLPVSRPQIRRSVSAVLRKS
jgi:ubiquinone/menaquinone biosynthesis C-methylase UbiE